MRVLWMRLRGINLQVARAWVVAWAVWAVWAASKGFNEQITKVSFLSRPIYPFPSASVT
jgi:hypothetical protein